MALKRLGQILIDLGLINEQQLPILLEEQNNRGGELLGRVGISMGMFSDEQLGEALAEQWNTKFVTLYDRPIPGNTIKLVSEPMGAALSRDSNRYFGQPPHGCHRGSTEN